MRQYVILNKPRKFDTANFTSFTVYISDENSWPFENIVLLARVAHKIYFVVVNTTNLMIHVIHLFLWILSLLVHRIPISMVYQKGQKHRYGSTRILKIRVDP